MSKYAIVIQQAATVLIITLLTVTFLTTGTTSVGPSVADSSPSLNELREASGCPLLDRLVGLPDELPESFLVDIVPQVTYLKY